MFFAMLNLNGLLPVSECALIGVMRVSRVVKFNPLVRIIPKVIPPKLFLGMLPSLPDFRSLIPFTRAKAQWVIHGFY